MDGSAARAQRPSPRHGYRLSQPVSETRLATDGECFLVTGALGCIGSWVLKQLVGEDVRVVAYDRPGASMHRAHLVMTSEELSRVEFVPGDVLDKADLQQAARTRGVTHVIHLAALQIPFVKADPLRGALVNVAGSTAVFEVARNLKGQIVGLVYASSAAVWGSPAAYPPGIIADDAHPRPTTLYGVFKLANEGTAAIYWQDHGIASIGLRPNIVWGPGRDQGLTSPPSKALLAAAVGAPYHMAWAGRSGLQYAPDVAARFVCAARGSAGGAEAFDLGGPLIAMREFTELIVDAVPEAAGRITYDPTDVPQLELSGHRLEARLGPMDWTPMATAVRDSVRQFRDAAARGVLDVSAILSGETRP
jgi:UDP-glucuronate 4-epimerase